MTEVLGGLSARIIDAIEAEGAAVDLVKTFKMADGSGRWATLARLAAFGQEYGIRISAPAPPDAPAWARERHGGYEVVRLAGDQLD